MADGTPRGTALLWVPLYHIAGATNIMTTMCSGRRLVLLPQFDAGEWLETVEREGVTHAFVVPTMLKQLIDHPRLRAPRSLQPARPSRTAARRCRSRSSAAPSRCFRRTVGFVNAFGQTETTSTLTVLGPDDHRLDGTPAEVERNLKRLVSIGRPLPDVEVKVVDDDGNELPTGEVGELWVFTPRMMKGYAVEGRRQFAAPARTAGCRRATWAGSTRTATSSSPGARTT